MRKTVLAIILGLSFALTLGGCAKGVPIYQPEFQVQSRSVSQVRSAIKNVLKRRRWIIKSSGSNHFVARYDRGTKNGATVRIDYSSNKVKITRLNSYGLNYEAAGEEGEVIHKRFNGWMRYLERDIELELSYL